jgi:hypothetical protein
MAAAAERGVDVDSVRARVQKPHDFAEKHGLVCRYVSVHVESAFSLEPIEDR